MALLWLENDVTLEEEAQAQPRTGNTSIDRQIWEALHALEIETVPKPDRRSRYNQPDSSRKKTKGAL